MICSGCKGLAAGSGITLAGEGEGGLGAVGLEEAEAEAAGSRPVYQTRCLRWPFCFSATDQGIREMKGGEGGSHESMCR